MSKLKDFVSLYRLYRKHHGRGYALQRAWQIGFKGYPF